MDHVPRNLQTGDLILKRKTIHQNLYDNCEQNVILAKERKRKDYLERFALLGNQTVYANVRQKRKEL